MRDIFVFGSNLAGRHGKGAALAAMSHGAIYGQGEGLQGNAYAIPTKDLHIKTLPITTIQFYVQRFIEFAERNPYLMFAVTPIGCGLAGYRPEQIAPLFRMALDLPNVRLCDLFVGVLKPPSTSAMTF